MAVVVAMIAMMRAMMAEVMVMVMMTMVTTVPMLWFMAVIMVVVPLIFGAYVAQMRPMYRTYVLRQSISYVNRPRSRPHPHMEKG